MIFFVFSNGLPINRIDSKKSWKFEFPPIFDIGDKNAPPLEMVENNFFHLRDSIGVDLAREILARFQKILGIKIEWYPTLPY